MNFEVMSRRNAVKYSYGEHDERSVIISICCAWDESPKFNLENKWNGIMAIRYFKFDDIDKIDGRYYVDGGHSISNDMAQYYTSITDKDAEEIVKFVTQWKDKVDKIIVHCDAGISRSSACCAAIMKALTGNDRKIFENFRYAPNMTVYNKCLVAFANAGYEGVFGKHLKD